MLRAELTGQLAVTEIWETGGIKKLLTFIFTGSSDVASPVTWKKYDFNKYVEFKSF